MTLFITKNDLDRWMLSWHLYPPVSSICTLSVLLQISPFEIFWSCMVFGFILFKVFAIARDPVLSSLTKMLPFGRGEEEMDISEGSETIGTNINRSESIYTGIGEVSGAVESVTEEMEVGEGVHVEVGGLEAEDVQLPVAAEELGIVTVHVLDEGEGGLLTDHMPGLTRLEVISVLRAVAEADPEEARDLFAAAGLGLRFHSEGPRHT